MQNGKRNSVKAKRVYWLRRRETFFFFYVDKKDFAAV
ncbi:hypothetical protein J2T15_005172 [Paenibacillus harenae]|uniref:Uncharacterized protein n=1 Tax=Paenibacillus harenae TaxID=306543 RepID=A0ABT9UAG5_PAEHA|nr:hypothetical protein [Paenibacillus harenae]